MDFSWLTHEIGKIELGDKFVSIRLIKEVLEKHNRISTLEETSSWLKCRVFRIARIFGAPWMGPYPILYFRIERKHNETILHYDFFWPEYHAAAIISAAFGFALAYFEYQNVDIFLQAKMGILIAIACMLSSSFFIFIDTKYYSRIIRKELRKL